MSDSEQRDLGIDVLQRFIAWLDDVVIKVLIDKLGDPSAKSAVMEAMGLDPALGASLPDAKVPPGMRERVGEYAKTVDGTTDLAGFYARAADFTALLSAIVDIVEAGRDAAREAGDGALGAGKAAADEALRQLIARLNLEYMRRKTPTLYDVQKLMGFIDDTITSHYEDALFFSRIKRFVFDTGDFLDETFGSLSPANEREARLAADTFFVLAAIAMWRLTPKLRRRVSDFIPEIRPRYGYESAPALDASSATPNADAISQRTLTLGMSGEINGGDTGVAGSLTITFIFVPAEHGGPGLFVQFDGDASLQVPMPFSDSFVLSFELDLDPTLDMFIPYGDPPEEENSATPSQPFDVGGPSSGTFKVKLSTRDGGASQKRRKFALPGQASALSIQLGPVDDLTLTVTHPAPPGTKGLPIVGTAALRNSALVLDITKADTEIKDNYFKDTIKKHTTPNQEFRIDFDMFVVYANKKVGFAFAAGQGPKLRATLPGGLNFESIGMRADNLLVALERLRGQLADTATNPPTEAIARSGTVQPLAMNEEDGETPGEQASPNEEETGTSLTFATTLRFKWGGFAIAIENVGIVANNFEIKEGTGADIGQGNRSSAIGITEFEPAFKPPDSLAMKIDSSGFSGGGYALFNPDDNEYAGALHLRIKNRFDVNAFLLLNTRLPDNAKAFSLLVSLSGEWSPPLELGAGFTFMGIGGIFGWERSIDVDVLRDGIRTGSLDAVLMPKDPLSDLPRLMGVMRSVFPPAKDNMVIGLILKFGWGKPTLLELKIGGVLELKRNSERSYRRALLALQFKVFQPPDIGTVKLRVDGLGVFDSERNETTGDLAIFDSTLMQFSLSGDGIYRSRAQDENAFTGFSLGGFHPDFPAPTGIPKLKRLSLNLANGDNPRLLAECYLALTPNTIQAGFRIDFYYSKSGFTIEAMVGGDALIHKPSWDFVITIYAGATVKWHGRTLVGVELSGTLGGTSHTYISLRATISVWIWSRTFPYDHTFSRSNEAQEPAASDPLPDVVAALQDPSAWSTSYRVGDRTLVSLRRIEVEGAVVTHPLGRISARQRVVPMGIEIKRYNNARPRVNRRIRIDRLLVDGQAATDTRALEELFAPGEFLELSEDEALSRPSFEKLQGGIEVRADAVRFGGEDNAADLASVDIEFETIVIDDLEQASRGEGPFKPEQDETLAQVKTGAVRRRHRRGAGHLKYGDTRRGPVLTAPSFTVATRSTMDVASGVGDGADSTSFTDAMQRLERFIAQHPDQRSELQVIAQSNVLEDAA